MADNKDNQPEYSGNEDCGRHEWQECGDAPKSCLYHESKRLEALEARTTGERTMRKKEYDEYEVGKTGYSNAAIRVWDDQAVLYELDENGREVETDITPTKLGKLLVKSRTHRT